MSQTMIIKDLWTELWILLYAKPISVVWVLAVTQSITLFYTLKVQIELNPQTCPHQVVLIKSACMWYKTVVRNLTGRTFSVLMICTILHLLCMHFSLGEVPLDVCSVSCCMLNHVENEKISTNHIQSWCIAWMQVMIWCGMCCRCSVC
jgi:hypothetical protein